MIHRSGDGFNLEDRKDHSPICKQISFNYFSQLAKTVRFLHWTCIH